MELKKPFLTEKQKNAFEEEFSELISQASSTVQNHWQKVGGKIQWLNDMPISFGIESKLTRKLADQWVMLMNRLNDRRI